MQGSFRLEVHLNLLPSLQHEPRHSPVAPRNIMVVIVIAICNVSIVIIIIIIIIFNLPGLLMQQEFSLTDEPQD